MKRALLILALTLVPVLVGCQKATFWEKYDRTPVTTTSTSQGVGVAQAYTVVPKEGCIYCFTNGMWFWLNGNQWSPYIAEVKP